MKTRKYYIVLGFLCALYSCEDELVQIGDDQISYNDHLIPLVTTSCDGYCHATANHFATYDNIKEAVDSGELWRHVVVDQTMPLYGSGLQITESR